MHVLNTTSRTLSKSEIADYIKQFDQRSRLLLGIFEMGTRRHIGFIRLDIDYQAKDALVNAVIGEAEHRNRGATTEIFVPALDYLFNTVDLDRVKASVLRRNDATLGYLLRLGWQVDPVQPPPQRSYADGSPLELCAVSWSREGYRAFRETALGRRILRRMANIARKGQR